MKSLIIFLLLLFTGFTSSAQSDLKAIKKQIPVKGIKAIEQVNFAKELYIYRAKNDTGVWNNNLGKIILNHLIDIFPDSVYEKWVDYNTSNAYGIYDLSKDQSVLSSPTAFYTTASLDSNFMLIMSPDVYGMIDLQRMACYVINKNNPPTTIQSFFDEQADNGYESYSTGCSYDPEHQSFYYYGYESDGIQNMLTVKNLDDYLIENQSGYVYGMKVHQQSTGELKLDMYGGDIQKWKGGYALVSQNITYFDHDFKPIFEDIAQDEYTLEHFKTLFDDKITKVDYAGDGIYKCKTDGKYAFFSILPIKRISDWYDYIFYIGKDIYTNGESYYTVNNDHFGLYNTWRGVELDAKYHLIEMQIFNDTTCAYRADDELLYLRSHNGWSKYWVKDSVMNKWSDSMKKNSMVINHLSVKDSLLILSLRACEPDIHDYSYGTETTYEDGSGVLNLNTKKWVIEPEYHSFLPFKGYYITSDVGSSYRNWTKTQILDENFKPITDEEFDGAFIYQNQLIMRNKKWERVVYDVETKKVTKIIGKASAPFEDFLLKDGYLLIGSYNYDRDEGMDGFDIDEIISPDLKLTNNNKFGLIKMLPDELVIIGKYDNISERSYKRDYYGRSQGPEKQAIYDLKKNAIVTPWYNSVYINNYDNTITLDKQEMPLNEIRKVLKIN